MQINLDPPLAWLLMIQMTAMMIAVIWSCVIYHFATKKCSGLYDRSDAVVAAQKELLIRSETLSSRCESLVERQLDLIERAERLLKRLEDGPR